MALKINKVVPKTFEYTPESQREEENPFSVTFKKIGLESLATLQDKSVNINGDGSYSININSQHLNILKEALIGWENITDDNGKDVKFRLEFNKASNECIEMIPQDLRSEIGNVIFEVSKDPNNYEAIISGTIYDESEI